MRLAQNKKEILRRVISVFLGIIYLFIWIFTKHYLADPIVNWDKFRSGQREKAKKSSVQANELDTVSQALSNIQ